MKVLLRSARGAVVVRYCYLFPSYALPLQIHRRDLRVPVPLRQVSSVNAGLCRNDHRHGSVRRRVAVAGPSCVLALLVRHTSIIEFKRIGNFLYHRRLDSNG